MDLAVESLVGLSEVELLAAYQQRRQLYATRKFARDSELGRLEWQSARLFAATPGRVTERSNAVKTSEPLAKKSQQIREMTQELDLLKADVDVLAMVLCTRGSMNTQAYPIEPPNAGATNVDD